MTWRDFGIRIMAYSGAAFDSDKREARDAGAQGYLTKPDGIGELVDEVAKLIAADCV